LRAVLKKLEIPFGKGALSADVMVTELDRSVPVYLIEREDLYDRPNLYGNARGDYYDNLERFSFYCHAAIELSGALGFKPDIIHCHDWQTGLVPALMKGVRRMTPSSSVIPTIFTIHNLGYPGVFPAEKIAATGLSSADFLHPGGVEYWGNISLLKAGIVYSEAITTVSPTYAQEIQTPEFGMGMDGILRGRSDSIHGILNGVDYSLWDPVSDSRIAASYSQAEMAGKAECKEALIHEMALEPSSKDKPILGMISRLDSQKGLDLLVAVVDEILALDTGLVVLGSGDEVIQASLEKARKKHPERVGFKIGFDETLAHRIMAGADIFLIPSRYEPCGLTQMYALKYGTVPVVRATGGLEDTVTQYNEKTGKGNGFKFKPYKPRAFLAAIREAIGFYEKREVWSRIRFNGMGADFSWDRSARKYIDLYEKVAEGSSG
jgi:starch synthase